MFFLILAYLLYLIIFGIFSYLALYHLWRFGFVGDATKTMMIGYTTTIGIVIIISFVLIAIIPWLEEDSTFRVKREGRGSTSSFAAIIWVS